jgi:hypothetical protein
MREVRTARAEGCQSWGWALIGLLLFSLIVTLVTRFQGSVRDTVTVQSNSPQPMGQHMDRDAVRWAAPVLPLALLQAPIFLPHVTPAGPPLPTFCLEESLYNRPPPAC